MTRFKCTVAYVGANYEGWQAQRNGNSIQQKIESAIEMIAQKKVGITASGRTDAGVSAKGQVFHFDSDMNMSAYRWTGAINGKLPKDIHIVKTEKVDDLFHARYTVKSKRYVYCINMGPYDVFTKDTAYQCPYRLNVAKMKTASRYLIGTHDFSSFCANSYTETPEQTRTVFCIDFAQEGDMLRIAYEGDGFLRYMVRMITAELIEVGREKLQPQDIEKILCAKSKTYARKNAVPQGLTLERVDYYKLLALGKNAMVREFLFSDANVSDDKNAYAVMARNNSRMLGWYFKDRKVLEIFEDKDLLLVEDIRATLEDA